MNSDWEGLFPLTQARKIPRFMSDHNPLILDTCENILPKSKEFCFEKSWLLHEDFMSRVELAWHSSVSAIDSLGIVQSK